MNEECFFCTSPECDICIYNREKCPKEEDEQKKQGFTLVEMLIVVAIIGVLVAIALPTLGSKLETSREVADLANLRAAYSEAISKHYLDASTGDTETITGVVKLTSSGSLEYADADGLPFTLPEKFSFSPGTYSATFDFSAATPTVALKATTD